MCESTKTLSAINRLFFEPVCPSSIIADFFTCSPWDNVKIKRHSQSSLVEWVIGEREGHLIKLKNSHLHR